MSLHYSAIRAGLGVGLLACAVGDSHDDLVRVSGTFCDPQLTLWVLHRRELRSNVRVTAFFRHLRTALLRQKVLIVGDRPAHEERRIAAFDDHDEIESAMADKVG